MPPVGSSCSRGTAPWSARIAAGPPDWAAGEKFHDAQPQPLRRLQLRRRHSAGIDRQARRLGCLDNTLIQPGGDDKLGPGPGGFTYLGRRHDGPGADEKLGLRPPQPGDGRQRSRGTQYDLRHGDAALHQGPG